jgi:hypothetical protein
MRILYTCQKCGAEVGEGEGDHNGRHPYCGGQLDPMGSCPEDEERITTMTRAEIEASFRRALGVKDEKPEPPSITHSHRCPHQGCGTWKCINADAICTLPEVAVCPPCDEGEVLLKK